jgi:small subunit ribosomal protein S20
LANHKSALKRARQSEVRQTRNKMLKTRIKNTIKKVRLTIEKEPQNAYEPLKKAMSILHKAASKGTIHPKNAARRISRLAKQQYLACRPAEQS